MKIILIRSRSIDSAVFKIAKTLSNNNYNVHLLIWDRQNTLNVEDYPFKIHKFSLKAPHDKYSALIYLPFWWIYEFYFLLKNNPDIIHACDLDTLWPAIAVKLIRRKKLFYTIYDFYAGHFSKDIIINFLSFIEKYGISFTEILFLVDKSRYEQIKDAKINKILYVYNSPPDIISSYDKSDNKRKSNDVILFYGGGLDNSRGIKQFIESVKDLTQIKLIIAGSGNDKGFVEESSRKNKNLQYLGWISHEDIIKNTLNSDVILAFYDPSIPNNKYASPNKLFEAMMTCKPIITNSETNASNIVKEEECGIIVEYGNVEAISKAIITLRDDPQLRLRLGNNGRNAYENKYNWNIMEARLLSAYKL